MKKLLFFPLAVAMLAVCACGNKTTDGNAADSDTVVAVDSDSIREADSLKAAAEQAKADSVKAAEEAKKAEEAKAAAQSQKVDEVEQAVRDLEEHYRSHASDIANGNYDPMNSMTGAIVNHAYMYEDRWTPAQRKRVEKVEKQLY